MRAVITWIYRAVLVFPVLWTLNSFFWYGWVTKTFGYIPHNDYLYAINDLSPTDKMLDFFMNTGDITLVGLVLSSFALFTVFCLHLLAYSVFNQKATPIYCKHDGIIFLSVSLLFSLNFLPGLEPIFQSYLNYLLD